MTLLRAFRDLLVAWINRTTDDLNRWTEKNNGGTA